MPVELIIGPPVKGPNSMSRTAAEEALKRNPLFPKEAEYKIEAHAGNWIAAFSTTKTAAPFGGPPSDEEEPKEEAPSSDGPPSDGPPSDDGGPDGPPSGEEHKEKGGDKGGIHAVDQKLDIIMQALGIDPTMGQDSMVPGPDDGMGGPPGGPGGPGAGGPPPGPGGPGGMAPPPGHPAMAKAPDKTVHERALKPGEVPPGGTPLGAPAFSSVREQHPWGHMIGKVPHFRVAEDIGQQDIVEVERELQSLASAGGFRVSNFTPMHGENGERLVSAVISTPAE